MLFYDYIDIFPDMIFLDAKSAIAPMFYQILILTRKFNEAVHEKDSKTSKAEHKLDVGDKVRPLPEIATKVHLQKSLPFGGGEGDEFSLITNGNAQMEHQHHHEKHEDRLGCWEGYYNIESTYRIQLQLTPAR